MELAWSSRYYARDMAEWRNGGGFSVDASVRIEADDRAGLERLLRYCARPPFALERLEALDEQRFITEVPWLRPLSQRPPSLRVISCLPPSGGGQGWRRRR